jgi:thiosulfate/3-mercaptopyruvate sulfurtransferase
MVQPVYRLSTEDLRERLDDPQLQLVDVRPIDAYNGWRLRAEARGGHIPGARTLPFKWHGYLDWIEIVRAKGIRPERPLVVYGYDVGEAERVARTFSRAGYRNVGVYPGFTAEWCAHERLPMERLPRFRHLVPPGWLRELITRGTAPEHAGGPYVLCHAHYRNRGDYEKGHIPGAVELDTNTLESPVTWNRRSPAEVRATLEKLGITRDSTVVLYGRFSFPDSRDPFPGSSAGQLAAFRCAFIMLWAGVEDVRVLNGGVQSWTDAGFDLTTAETEKRPVADFGSEIPGAPKLAVDLAEAKTILASDDANLVCVRSWPEYIGEVSGYNYIEKKGRIPGAVFAECGTDAYHMENYRNLDHTSREYGEIEASWKAAGITPDKHNAFYCGTGWRGSEAFFTAWLLGWPRVSVYDGGWFEWSNDPGNPIETGIPGQLSAVNGDA